MIVARGGQVEPILRRLDEGTVDRLLAGKLSPDEAPPGWDHVASLFQAASSPPVPNDRMSDAALGLSALSEDSMRDQETVEAMMAALADSDAGGAPAAAPARIEDIRGRLRAKVASATVAATLVLGSGLAAAGELPAPAQNAISAALAKVGLSVPRAETRSAERLAASSHRGGRKEGGHRGSGKQDRAGRNEQAAAAGPDAGGAARHGLCRAFFSGQGGTRGGKNDSVAMTNLQEAAQGAGQSVEEFCAAGSPPRQRKVGGPGAARGGGQAKGTSQGNGSGGNGSQRHEHSQGAGSAPKGQPPPKPDPTPPPGAGGSGKPAPGGNKKPKP